MKKWIVLVIVLLLGIMLGLQHLLNKREVKVSDLAKPTQQAETGGAMPDPAPAMLAVPMKDTSSSAFGDPAASLSGFQSACTGGISLDDFVTAREGINTLKALYDPHKTDKVFKAMNSYFICKAVAENDTALCEYLPAQLPRGVKDVKESPRNACAQPVKETLFTAYMAGKYPAGEADCLSMAKENSYPDPEQFCGGVLKVGMEKVCSLVPAGERKTGCLREYPAKKTDCPGGESKCLRRLGIYTALKAGDPSQCPEGYQATCDAVLMKSRGASCFELGDRAVKLYCSYLEEMNKKEAKQVQDEESKRLDAQKKEQQKMMDEINRQARQTLGKK